MLTKRIAHASNTTASVMNRVRRSLTVLQAERLAPERLEEVCLRAGISAEPSTMDQHRRISAKASQLFRVAEHLPNNDEALSAVTELLDYKMMGSLIYLRAINPRMSLRDIRAIARYLKASSAFDNIRRTAEN